MFFSNFFAKKTITPWAFFTLSVVVFMAEGPVLPYKMGGAKGC
jgi:hypothetical protein